MKCFSVMAALLLCACMLSSQEATTFRGNLEHTGTYSSTGPSQSAALKWKFHTGAAIFSSPAIANGTIYVGSGDNNLYAINLDGTLKWKFKTKSRVASSPSIVGGMVYFGSWDGIFYAVDAATGKQQWQFQTSGEHRFTATHLHGSQPVAESMPDPFDCYLSSPAVWNGAVYFGSGDGHVYSLEAATGKLKWKFETKDVVHASPAIADGRIFIGSWDSFFYSIDASTGKEIWRFKTGEDADTHNQVGIQSSAAVADSTVYFGCRDSNFYALDVATGRQKWKFNNKGSWVISSPAVRDGKVYFSTSDSGMLYEFDAKSGTQRFSWSSKHWPMFSSPALATNNLYIGSQQGNLIAIDLTTHKQTVLFETDASKQNSPVYTKADGSPNYELAYASDFYDDMIVGLSKINSLGGIFSSPVLSDGVIYVGSIDGNLYALQ